MWLALCANLAIVGFFLSIWANLQDWVLHRSAMTHAVVLGSLMAVASAAAMLFATELAPGVFFDLRTTTVATAAMLGGPVAGLIAAAATVVIRLVMGGAGTLAGVMTVVLSLLAGLAGRWMWGRNWPTPWEALLVSLLVASTPLICTVLLPDTVRMNVLSQGGAAIFVLTFAATIAAVSLVTLNSKRAAERALLLGAIAQAPDYFYVKSTSGKFVAVNGNVAKIAGFAAPALLKGRTDHDLTDAERADALRAEEQHVIASGDPLLDKHETVVEPGREPRHFVTSKTPVRLDNGAIIGLVGVSRDVTGAKNAELELGESRDQLSFILQEMSDGVALVSHEGYFILTNQRYRDLFPRTGRFRVAGSFYPEILQQVVDSGEQPDVERARAERWIAELMRTLREGGEEIVRLYDNQWLHIRTKVHSRGLSTIVVSDITAMKRAETDLLVLTRQLELLAATDGLTHILNRRGFDEAIEREIARAGRTGAPISVVMIDVDWFKAYNDKYGHLAGDECLRSVAAVLRGAATRPVDVVARYGGEEFAVLLPETNGAGAQHVAEQIRLGVHGQNISHAASELGRVTVSLGVATLEGSDPELSSKLLLGHADEALYLAKDGGRDRTETYRLPKPALVKIAGS